LVVTSNAGEDVTERLDPSETVSPSNLQLPPIVVPSTITAYNASTVASLRMVLPIIHHVSFLLTLDVNIFPTHFCSPISKKERAEVRNISYQGLFRF
jgi:hypothetical protein